MKRTHHECRPILPYSNEKPIQSLVAARKKRRGVIEKRRRDRINNSLAELRRLIPATAHKKSSPKMEKAEILQMTIDHIKAIQNFSGFRPFGSISGFEIDYHSFGFRECLDEVRRFFMYIHGTKISSITNLVSYLQDKLNRVQAADMSSRLYFRRLDDTIYPRQVKTSAGLTSNLRNHFNLALMPQISQQMSWQTMSPYTLPYRIPHQRNVLIESWNKVCL
ncbi:unnamed protein product [Clavelina lepadiformis]|uniref:BHLH domain-containing protein n=1 Tax=Clavelina lepadiformis TaxID=159417 RepID=A0ABP0GW46_CLALP